jgi:plastocyanin
MPFSWIININPNAGKPAVKFTPSPLLNVAPGDEVVWANNDANAHWPGLKNSDGTIDATFFMPNQIAGQSTSPGFSPGVDGTLTYACSLHPDETGTIEVIAI